MKNDVLDAALAELRAQGATVLAIEYGRHIKVRFEHQGRTLSTVVPRSTSCHRATKNQVAFLRRAMKG